MGGLEDYRHKMLNAKCRMLNGFFSIFFCAVRMMLFRSFSKSSQSAQMESKAVASRYPLSRSNRNQYLLVQFGNAQGEEVAFVNDAVFGFRFHGRGESGSYSALSISRSTFGLPPQNRHRVYPCRAPRREVPRQQRRDYAERDADDVKHGVEIDREMVEAEKIAAVEGHP